MKYKIFEPNNRFAEKKNREIDEEKFRMNTQIKEEFNFEKELIDVLNEFKYRIPSNINVDANIYGLGLGFNLGIIFSAIMVVLFVFIFKIKI